MPFDLSELYKLAEEDEPGFGAMTEPVPVETKGIFSGIYDHMLSFFTAQFRAVWSGFNNQCLAVYYKIFKHTTDIINQGEDAAWDVIFKLLKDTSILDEQTIESLMKLKGLPFPINSLVYMTALPMILGGYLKDMGGIMTAGAKYDLQSRILSEIPNPRDVVQAAFIAPEKTGAVREVFKKAGISDEYTDLFFLSMYRPYNEQVIQMLWLRKAIDDDTMFMRMRELGYTDTRIKEIIQSWSIIPGPQDLLTMVAHEAFEPDAIELMGLGDEFPVAQVEWLQKQGLSEDWAKRYWYAHWEQPSVQMGYEMLHRGVIGQKELDMLYKTVEIPPFWRDKLTKIAYQPYSRVDVRRMHKLGVVNDQELLQSYMDLGYDEEKAEKMALFTVRYNQGAEKLVTKGQILEGFRDKFITEKDAVEMLVEIGYGEDLAQYTVTLEQYKEEKAYVDMMITNIQDRYENNLIDATTARDRLGKLNLPAIKTDLLMDRWGINKFEDKKVPSKTDLDKMYKAKVIDESEWRAEMQVLAYSQKYINWYWSLILKGK